MAVHTYPTLVLVAGLVVVAAESAAVVRVVPDAYPTIQAAIDASASDDTVIVRAGEYGESLKLAGKDIVVIGAGAASTAVRPPTASRALRIGAGVTLSTEFQGISFTHGEADSGGGVYVAELAACAFRSCGFVSNVARAPNRSLGGGIFVNTQGQVQLRGCELRDNLAALSPVLADAYGGGIFAVGGATIDAESTRFVHNTAAGFEGGFGGAVALEGNGFFRHCVFDSNVAGYGGCIAGNGFLSVSNCLFRFNQGVYGTSTLFFSGNPYSVQFSLFHDNVSLGWHTLQVAGTGSVEFNTFAFNTTNTHSDTTACVAWEGTSTTVRNNIVAQNRQVGLLSYALPPAGSVSCNDAWLNRDGDYGRDTPNLTWLNGNLSVNPFFCDSTSRMLDLRAGSACASGGACGQIGALSEACPGVGVDVARIENTAQLMPSRPHPLQGAGILEFQLPVPSHVRLEILDVTGRRVAVVADRAFPAGRSEQSWSGTRDDGKTISPGVYVLRLEAGAFRRARKLVVLE